MRLWIAFTVCLLGANPVFAAAPAPSAPSSTGPSAPPVAPAPMTAVPTPAPVSMPPEPPPKGTIVAVAQGTSCTWTINGISHGTHVSIRVDVRPAAYTVTCRTKTASKSRSFFVKSGETAMVMIKFP